MKKLTIDIDLNKEADALADYIRQKWTPIQGIRDLFREIADRAMHDARAWLDTHDAGFVANDLSKARAAALKPTLASKHAQDLATVYDSPCSFLNHVFMMHSRLVEGCQSIDGNWDYSRQVDRLHDALAGKYSDLRTSRPVGWDALAKDYDDFDGQEEYRAKSDMALCQACDISTVSAGNFVSRTALPYVMYDEKCQGRKASRVLVGAVYAQFLGIATYLNTQKLIAALNACAQGVPVEMVFDFKVNTGNPHLKVLMAMQTSRPTHTEYEEALEKWSQWDKVPAAEKAARKKAHEEEGIADTKALIATMDSAEYEQNRLQEKETTRKLLLEHFGA